MQFASFRSQITRTNKQQKMNWERSRNLNFLLPLLGFTTFIEIRDMAKPSPTVLEDADGGSPPLQRLRWRMLGVHFDDKLTHYCQNQRRKPYSSGSFTVYRRRADERGVNMNGSPQHTLVEKELIREIFANIDEDFVNQREHEITRVFDWMDFKFAM